MSRTLITVAATLFLLQAAALRAQERPERPYRGLFGGDDESLQGLSVSGSLGAGYDTDLASDASDVDGGNTDFGNRPGGVLGQFSGSLAYFVSRGSANLSANAGTTGRYYPSATDKLLRRHNAGIQGSTPIGAGFTVSGSASYSPFRVWDLYTTPVPARSEASDAFDFGSSSAHYLAYSGSLGGGWQLSRRLSFGASYRYGGRAASADIPKHASHSAGANMRYDLARGLALNLGYGYREARYEDRDKYVTHGINAGIDFSRALSFSRRTTLSFSTGTSAAGSPSSGEGLQYYAVGDAALSHEIGRTWRATVSYSRSLQISEYWPEPIFSDGVSGGLTGLVNRRVQVHSRAGASSGQVSTEDSGGFDTYFADAGVTFSLTRHVGFGTSYRYYHHQFSEAFRLLPGMPPVLDRHSLHAHVTVWAPLFQHRRP